MSEERAPELRCPRRSCAFSEPRLGGARIGEAERTEGHQPGAGTVPRRALLDCAPPAAALEEHNPDGRTR